jgi:YfiH family protein
MRHPNLLIPDWPVVSSVHAASTLRTGGVSTGSYSSFNLGLAVGDDPAAVAGNRRRLRDMLSLQNEPLWLKQVHGTTVLDASDIVGDCADARVTDLPQQTCIIMTADCLPVLFSSRDGKRIGAAHAGWRGLVSGVLEATIKHMKTEPRDLLAWIGPAIGRDAFEVGEEVREAFLQRDTQSATAFTPNARGRWQADLVEIARQRLRAAGVSNIYGGRWCTYSNPELFFSHRRDGHEQPTGRMATLIWRD